MTDYLVSTSAFAPSGTRGCRLVQKPAATVLANACGQAAAQKHDAVVAAYTDACSAKQAQAAALASYEHDANMKKIGSIISSILWFVALVLVESFILWLLWFVQRLLHHSPRLIVLENVMLRIFCRKIRLY